MNFNKSQTWAIRHKDGPMLVLAGPGSGKTAVITHRTKNLIEEYKVSPSNILVITFTKAAAMEMKQRFERLMGQSRVGVSFGTFHGIFFTILKYAYGFQSSNIVSEEQRYEYVREAVSYHNLDIKDESEFIGNVLGEISYVKNSRLDINHYYSNQCGEEVFRDLYEEYHKRLKRNRLIDFDDMLTYTYELFTERKDILAAWQKKYQYILVDEFQDINSIQYDIIKMLAAPENNLFIVGDDDQSIYRFRGSKPEIMLNFTKDYPEAKRVLLDYNYRCDANIVESSLKLIGHNEKRFTKEIQPARQAVHPVNFMEFENQREENLYLIRQIALGIKEGRNFSDYAILFRTNIQPRFLMELLMSYNIPFKTKEKIPNLYEHWIARDIFTYIRIAQGSRSRADFLQIMNRPKRYIGRDSLCETTVAFDEWEKLYDEQPWIAERIERLEYDIKMLGRMSPYAAINYIRKGIGYDDYIAEYAEYRQMNQEDLYDILEELQAGAKGFKTYEEWQAHIADYSKELEELAKKKQANPNAVTLVTLHGAKGLEFSCVFIIDVNEGLIPYKKAVLPQELEEERRMFYVGVTRAKEELYIYSVKNLHNKDQDISRFAKEMGLKED